MLKRNSRYVEPEDIKKLINHAFIQRKTTEFLNDGGEIKRIKRVLFEPHHITRLFEHKKFMGV